MPPKTKNMIGMNRKRQFLTHASFDFIHSPFSCDNQYNRRDVKSLLSNRKNFDIQSEKDLDLHALLAKTVRMSLSVQVIRLLYPCLFFGTLNGSKLLVGKMNGSCAVANSAT